MTISKTLFGSSVDVPETAEENWGDDVTWITVGLIDGVNYTVAVNAGGLYVPSGSVARTTGISASASLATTAHKRIVAGSGAITLSTGTPIVPGTVDGEEFILVGSSDSNTVTIQNSGTVSLNGDITLGAGDALSLWWDDTSSVWRELSRSN